MATKTKAIPVVWGGNRADNEGRDINGSYLHLTNSRPTELPYYDSYRNNFTNLKSRSDRGGTAWNIRSPAHTCGFQNEVVLNPDGTIDLEAPQNFFFKDVVCCGGDRFYLIDSVSQKENGFCDDTFLIGKQCDASYKSGCDTFYRSCCEGGSIKVIGSFPHKPCTYDKFTKMKGPIGKPKYEAKEAILRVDRQGDYTFWSVYDKNGAIQGNVGDWIYIKEDNGAFSANAGYLNQITGVNQDYGCGGGGQNTANLIVSAPRPDIVPICGNGSASAIQNGGDIDELLKQCYDDGSEDADNVCSFYEYKYVSVCVYEEVGETFAFATSDGVVMYSGDDACDTDGDPEGSFVYIPNTQPDGVGSANGTKCEGGVTITSVFNYYGQTGYIINGNIILNSPGSYLAQDVLDASEYGYTHAIPVNDLLVFIGPESAGALTNSTTGRQLSPIFNQQGSGIGYFNPGSYVNRLEDFYMISNGGHIYQLSFSASTVENTGQYVFKPIIEDIDLYMRHDLGMMDKRKGDYMYMSATEEHLEIYMGSRAHNYTQILLLDRHDSVWYDEKICGAQIYGKKCGCFIGLNGIYNFDGEGTKVENEVNQLISGMVDVSRSNRKYFHFLRIDIGYNSNISENTILKLKILDDGCEKPKMYRLDNFGYVQDLNKQKNMEEDEMMSTNGVYAKVTQKVKTEEPCFQAEMKAFCEYKLSHKDIISNCDDYEKPEGCNTISNKTKINKVAKFATLHFPIHDHGHVLKREISSHSGDNIEYISAYLEMQYEDEIDVNKHSTFNSGISK